MAKRGWLEGVTRSGAAGVGLLLAMAGASCAGPVDPEVGVTRQAITEQPDEHCTLGAYNGHEYWFCGDDRSWSDARARCQAVGAQLARIDDAAENSFVRGRLVLDAWIGGSDSQAEGQWRWSDDNAQFWNGGPAGSAVGGRYVSWQLGQPNDLLGEDCTALAKLDGRWDDRNCAIPGDYVCETSAATSSYPRAPDTGCFRGQQGGHDYWFCRDGRSFATARQNCEAIGMQLAAIDTPAENAYLASRIAFESYVGLSDAGHESAWKWLAGDRPTWCGGAADGHAPSEAYANWAPLQPFVNSACEYATRNGRAYWFCSDPRGFDQARAGCQSAGMELVRIDDAAENAFVRQKLLLEVWLGGSDQGHQNDWRWTDGDQPFWLGDRLGHPVAGRYANWDLLLPANSSTRNCLGMHALTGKWGDKACAELRQWACEGPEPTEPQRPDTLDCGTLRPLSGQWAAVECGLPLGYVCENVEPEPEDVFGAETDRVRYEPKTFQIAKFDVHATGGDSTPAFLRYREALGLRDCIDTLEPTSEPHRSSEPDTEIAFYEQHYRGIPVIGYGYKVHRAVSDGAVKRAVGRLLPDLQLQVTPQIDADEARQIAAAAYGVAVAELVPEPETELVIVPPGGEHTRPERRLAWRLYLSPLPNGLAAIVDVAADDGTVLNNVTSELSQCASLAVAADATLVTGRVDSRQVSHYGDSDLLTLSVDTLPNAVLANEGIFVEDNLGRVSPGPGSLSTHPQMSMSCEEGSRNTAVRLPTTPDSSTDFGTWSTDTLAAAQFMIAMQRSLEYFHSRFVSYSSNGTATPWLGLDGEGQWPISIRIDHVKGTEFDPMTHAMLMNPNQFVNLAEIQPGPVDPTIWAAAAIDVAAHEWGHAVFHKLVVIPDRRNPVQAFASQQETRQVGEGLGDIFAALAEFAHRRSESSMWCLGGDRHRDAQCFRRSDDPGAVQGRVFDPRQTSAAKDNPLQRPFPDTYLVGNYCVSDPSAICDPHYNSTVFSHWAQLLVDGGAGTNAAGCSYNVKSLGADTVAASEKAGQLVFKAVQENFALEAGFSDMANATLTAADSLISSDPGTWSSADKDAVTKAWAAVGVWEDFNEDHRISPVRGQRKVYPWTPFLWRPDPSDPNAAWDIDVSLTPEFNDTGVIHRTATKTTVVDSVTYKVADDIALEPNSGPYYWRVRPSGTAPACFPIHFIESTGEAPIVTSLSSDEDDPETTPLEVEPGGSGTFANTSEFKVAQVQGARGYYLQAARTDTGCQHGAGEFEHIVNVVGDPAPGTLVPVSLFGLQPEEDYVLMIEPLGPHGSGRLPARGRCKTFPIRTKKMTPPDFLSPANNSIFGVRSPHNSSTGPLRWSWFGHDGPASYEVRFFLPEQCGDPNAQPHKTVPTTQPMLEADVFPTPNPTGYCWEVVGVGANGKKSPPSERLRFKYNVPVVQPISPGEPLGQIEADYLNHTGLISYAFYNKDVTLSWQPHPDAVSYTVKLGKWPWRNPRATPDPANCESGCNVEPVEVTYRAENVTGTSVVVPKEKGGIDRYCWTVWPVMAGNVQPLVEPEIYCYHTGMSDDLRVQYDPGKAPPQPQPPVEFVDKEIAGTVFCDYTFNGACTINVDVVEDGSPPNPELHLQPSPGCAGREVTNVVADWTPDKGWLFDDRFKCSWHFSFRPERSKRYMVLVDLPPPLGPNASAVIDDFLSGGCGFTGEPCCANDSCHNPSDTCGETSRKCEACTHPPRAPEQLSPLGDQLGLFQIIPATEPLRWERMKGVTHYRILHATFDVSSGQGVPRPDPLLPFQTTEPLLLPTGVREVGLCTGQTAAGITMGDIASCPVFYSWNVQAVNDCGVGPWSDGAFYGVF